MDRIDTIVEMAITYTLTVLRTAPKHFDVARAGLERLRRDLTLDVPDHRAAERLRSFLETLEVRVAEKTNSLIAAARPRPRRICSIRQAKINIDGI